MINIIIADDHGIVREGFSLIVENTEDMELLSEVDNGYDLIENVKEKSPDVVVTDINMPGLHILDLVKELKIIRPSLKIIVFTVNPESIFAKNIIKAGATAYVNKKDPIDILIKTIREIHAGRKFFTEKTLNSLISEPGQSENSILKGLSERELQILCMIAKGKTAIEIAEELFVSKYTINNHQKNILRKLGLKTKSELIIYAYKNNLVE